MAIETYKDVVLALGGNPNSRYNYHDDALSYCLDAVKNCQSDKKLLPLVGERVVEIVKRNSPIWGQRLLESCDPLWKKEDFDFEEYSRLYTLGLRRLGFKANNEFGRNLENAYDLGLKPKEFYDQIDTAVDIGGKIFGGYFAKYLTSVLTEGGNIQQFRSYSAKIKGLAGLKAARDFMQLSPSMFALKDPPFSTFGDFTAKSATVFGKDCTQWFIRATVPLRANFSIYPDQFFQDCQKITILAPNTPAKQARAVKWFAYGMGNIASRKGELENSLPLKIHDLEQYRYIAQEMYTDWGTRMVEIKLREIETAKKGISTLHPDQFKKDYQTLLQSSNQSAATYFSLISAGSRLHDPEYPHLASDIINFHLLVPKNVFSQAMWFLPRMRLHCADIQDLFREIADSTKRNGAKETIKALRYTWGCNIRGTFTGELIFPEEKTKKWSEQWDNLGTESLVEQEQMEQEQMEQEQMEQEPTEPDVEVLSKDDEDKLPF